MTSSRCCRRWCASHSFARRNTSLTIACTSCSPARHPQNQSATRKNGCDHKLAHLVQSRFSQVLDRFVAGEYRKLQSSSRQRWFSFFECVLRVLARQQIIIALKIKTWHTQIAGVVPAKTKGIQM